VAFEVILSNRKQHSAVIFPSKVYSQKLPYVLQTLSLLYNLLNLKNYTNH